MEDDGSDTEGADARLSRRVQRQKCIAEAEYKCDGDSMNFCWLVGTLKVKRGGKVNIRRTGDENAWKHDLRVVDTQDQRLYIKLGSKLPLDISSGFWQIDIVTNTVQRDLIIQTIEWFAKASKPLKESDAGSDADKDRTGCG